MILRGVAWLGLFVLVFLVTVLAALPAAWVWHYLPQQPSSPVRLEQLQGRWWQGQAEAFFERNYLGQVQWHLDWSQLWQGPAVAVDLVTQGPWLSGQGQLSATLSAAQGRLQQADVPITQLPTQLGFADLKVTGGLLIEQLLGRYQWQEQSFQLQGEALWRQASFAHSLLNDAQSVDMGAIKAIIRGQTDRISVDLKQHGNGPGCDLTLVFFTDGRYQLSGRIETATASMQLLFPQQRNGWAELNYQGRWGGLQRR